MAASWLLVEWIQKDMLCQSFDVVDSKRLVGKQDVGVGKMSILRVKHTNDRRPGKVLCISGDKELLKKMRNMLVNMKEHLRTTTEMFNNTIEQMKTEIMEECQRSENTRITPGIVNGNFTTTQKTGKKLKTTDDKGTQTAQRYSPKYITKLRNSLTKGYEEITVLMLELKKDPSKLKRPFNEKEDIVDGEYLPEPKDQTKNRIVTAQDSSKKSKRDTEDDFTTNAGPITNNCLTWNEQNRAMIEDITIVMESKGTPKPSTPSMRQCINRKVLSAVNNVDNTESNTHIRNQKQNNNLTVTKISAKDYHEDELTKETVARQSEEDVAAKSVNCQNLDNNEETINNNMDKTQEDMNLDNNEETINNNMDKTQEDMVPIGNGNTLIPKQIYENLKWDSYTSATRKLLAILFPREVLSTHSLSGKPSPAFANKPAKKQLNPLIIDDIVTTVSKKCDINESCVRTCITIKCADEAKMLKQRTGRSQSIQNKNSPISKNK